MTFKIDNRKIGLDLPLVIAEIGINHNGSLETAMQTQMLQPLLVLRL